MPLSNLGSGACATTSTVGHSVITTSTTVLTSTTGSVKSSPIGAHVQRLLAPTTVLTMTTAVTVATVITTLKGTHSFSFHSSLLHFVASTSILDHVLTTANIIVLTFSPACTINHVSSSLVIVCAIKSNTLHLISNHCSTCGSAVLTHNSHQPSHGPPPPLQAPTMGCIQVANPEPALQLRGVRATERTSLFATSCGTTAGSQTTA